MLTEVREALIADLAPVGVPLYSAWPEPFNPPGILVLSAPTYVTAGESFGPDFVVSLDLDIVVPRSNPARELAEIDAIIEAVLLNTADWAVRGVDGMGLFFQGVGLPGSTVHISKPIQL